MGYLWLIFCQPRSDWGGSHDHCQPMAGVDPYESTPTNPPCESLAAAMSSQPLEPGVEAVGDSIIAAAPTPEPLAAETPSPSPTAGPGPATLANWLGGVPPTPATPPGLRSSSNSSADLPSLQRIGYDGELQHAQQVLEIPTSPPYNNKELRRNRNQKRPQRPTTLAGRAP